MNDIDILIRRLRDGAELLKKGVANPSQAWYMTKAADMLAAFDRNRSLQSRDEWLFGNFQYDDYEGGIRHFNRVSLNTIRYLIQERFINPENRHNNAPSANDILAFAEESWIDCRVGGYAERDEIDGVYITSVYFYPANQKERDAVEKFFLRQDPDENILGGWWD